MMLSKVDLPQPEGPSRATNSSASTAKSTWLSATTSRPRRSANVLETRSTTTRIYRCRSANRWVLPVVVLGSSATKSIQRGDL
jgi:hypothetical protein